MSLYLKWSQKERSFNIRLAATLLAGVLFVILFPLGILRGGPALDRRLRLPRFKAGAGNYVLGGLLGAVGMFFAQWSIVTQLTRGRGTPLPILPTQELLTRGPFRYCRNPMTLGAILGYLGLGIAAGTPAGIGLVLLFGALLVLYLKRMEEIELAERFGEAYLRYRQETPFMLPRLPKRR